MDTVVDMGDDANVADPFRPMLEAKNVFEHCKYSLI